VKAQADQTIPSHLASLMLLRKGTIRRLLIVKAPAEAQAECESW
jgi:hypothetical protein